MKIVMLMSLVMVACASTIDQPKVPKQIQCPDMGTCLMTASEYCHHSEFIMHVQDGSQSGPTVMAWKPSSDSKFHLLINCK